MKPSRSFVNRRERLRGKLKRRGFDLVMNSAFHYLPTEARRGGFRIDRRNGQTVFGGDFDADLDAIEICLTENEK